MAAALRLLASRGTTALFLGVLLGLAWPDLAAVSRPLLAPIVGALLFFSLLAIDWPAVMAHLRSPLILAVCLAWVLVVAPLGSALVLSRIESPQALDSAIVLMACAPPILGSTAIALLLRLDGALTLMISIVATLIAPLTIPPLALNLLGIEIAIGPGPLMLRLATLVGLPFLLALVARRAIGRPAIARRATEINGILVFLMLIFAIAIMAEGAVVLRRDPIHFLHWALASLVANVLLQAATVVCFRWRGWRFALTLGLLTGNTNMGLLLATLPAGTDKDILLYFALAQLPMYMLPALQKRLYRRLIPTPEQP